MCKEESIIIKDGIDIIQIRTLIETTNTIARGLNEEEFLTIMKFYGKVADRLLNEI